MRVLIVLALVGCGPQLTTLTSNRHYREAVCAAHDGSDDDRDHVRRALARDADVRIHVTLVEAPQLSRALGADAGARVRGLRLARIQLATHTLPVDGLDASIAVTADRRSLSAPVTWERLAAATGEPLPPKRTATTYATTGNALRALGALFTLGTSLLVTHIVDPHGPLVLRSRRTIEVPAPRSEYLRMAPLATAIHDATSDHGCSLGHGGGGGRGLGCRWYVVLEPASAEEAIRLDVEVAYLADRDRRDARCHVTQRASVPLGRGRGLDDRIARMFGARTRTLSELVLE